MNNISSGRASSQLVRLFSGQPVRVAAAVLILAGGFSVTSSAYAQSQDVASCVEKCKAEEKACIHNGSSEELCDYDSKGCQKACNESK